MSSSYQAQIVTTMSLMQKRSSVVLLCAWCARVALKAPGAMVKSE